MAKEGRKEVINPTNEAEAREVLEVTIKGLIVQNYTPNEAVKLNATRASKEITDLFIEAYRKLKRNENVAIKDLD